MSAWFVPIVVCLSVGVGFFFGVWRSCRSSAKAGTPSASHNKARVAICPACCAGTLAYKSDGLYDCDRCTFTWDSGKQRP